MASRTTATVRRFGTGPRSDVRLDGLHVDELDRAGFDLTADGRTAHVQLRLLGRHQASNAAAAATVALALGLDLAQVADALTAATSTSKWRMELHERGDGVTVLNDAYNANPDSMRAALESLTAIGRERRTIAVLGEMRELGASSAEEHDAIGRLAVRLGVDRLLVVGEPARSLHAGACEEGGADPVFVDDNDAALTWLRDNLAAGDVVLFKASRAAGLERLAEAVLDQAVAGQARG
jgi:UDP-N-acetylmuramoyl-tripeptide--D-alanyl-D-alanine ligase